MNKTSHIYVWQPEQESKYTYGHDTKQDEIPKDEADEADAAGCMDTTLADCYIHSLGMGKLHSVRFPN